MNITDAHRRTLSEIWGAALLYKDGAPPPLDKVSRAVVRANLRQAMAIAGLPWMPADFSRIPTRIERMSPARAQVILAYTTDPLLNDLDRLPDTPTSRALRAKIKALKNIEQNSRIPMDEWIANIRQVFHFWGENRPVDASIPGEYVGYRLSVTKRDVVPFYVRMSKTKAPELLLYESRYKRRNHYWTGNGFALQVSDTLFITSHAHNGEGKDSRGLRTATFQKLPNSGCLFGIINTVDRDRIPFAARSVLVPICQHVGFEEITELTEQQIDQFVRQEWKNPEQDIPLTFKNPFHPYPNSRLFDLIDNWTNTALRAAVEPDEHYAIRASLRARAANIGKTFEELVLDYHDKTPSQRTEL